MSILTLTNDEYSADDKPDCSRGMDSEFRGKAERRKMDLIVIIIIIKEIQR